MKGALKLRFDRFSCQMFSISTTTNVTRLQCCIEVTVRKQWKATTCCLLHKSFIHFCVKLETTKKMPRLHCLLQCKKKNVKLILWLQLWVCLLLQDGWVGFKAVLLKKRLTAADFYNGYLHQRTESLFVSQKRIEAHPVRENSTL